MIAAFAWDSFFKFLPEILKSAASSPLGILALAIIATTVVMVFWGRDLPAAARSGILILMLLGLAGLTWRLASLSQTLPAERGEIEPAPEPAPAESTPPAHAASSPFAMPSGLAKHHLIGTDVSSSNRVDWSRVGETPITFVFLRASQGISGRDATLSNNWRAAGEAHLQRGVYHFFVADQDGTAQAANFLDALKLAGVDTTELPAALDLEEVPHTTRTVVDNFTFIKRVQAWLDTVENATKRKPVIYTNKPFWDAHGSDGFGAYPLWLPKYSNSAPTASNLPRGWKRWTFWQFGAETQFGAFGKVDANVFDPLSLLPISK